MDNFLEIKDLVEGLMETLYDGLNHIRVQLAHLRYEEALMLFMDYMEATIAIKDSLAVITDELGENNIDILEQKMHISMSYILECYERKEESKIDNRIMDNMMYNFINWRREVEETLIKARLN